MTWRWENPFKEKTNDSSDYDEQIELHRAQDEDEGLRLSIAQKQFMRKKLEESGLTVNKDFQGSLKKAWKWAKDFATKPT